MCSVWHKNKRKHLLFFSLAWETTKIDMLVAFGIGTNKKQLLVQPLAQEQRKTFFCCVDIRQTKTTMFVKHGVPEIRFS